MQLLPEDTARPHPDRMVTGWKREGVYEASRPSTRKPCIPIADDDPDIRESMCGAIASRHCVAVTPASGLEPLDILDHRHVDAALCDLVMSVWMEWRRCGRSGSGCRRSRAS